MLYFILVKGICASILVSYETPQNVTTSTTFSFVGKAYDLTNVAIVERSSFRLVASKRTCSFIRRKMVRIDDCCSLPHEFVSIIRFQV